MLALPMAVNHGECNPQEDALTVGSNGTLDSVEKLSNQVSSHGWW